MNRPITLFTGQWADMPFATLLEKASGWGFDGLELACWGDHLDVRRAVSDPAYARDGPFARYQNNIYVHSFILYNTDKS